MWYSNIAVSAAPTAIPNIFQGDNLLRSAFMVSIGASSGHISMKCRVTPGIFWDKRIKYKSGVFRAFASRPLTPLISFTDLNTFDEEGFAAT
jgi:hypothetical protein